METDCHNSIGEVEGLLDSVPVVNIDVNVEDSWVVLQQLENSQHYVVGVTEPTCLALFCMVHASAPVDCD